jgi:proline iminopeptidase
MKKLAVFAKNLHPSRRRSDMTAPRAIDRVERIGLGGTEQWIRIRGKDTSNPVLLLIQQGPGLPMLNEAADANKLWHLEDDFVVVYWDQRACGKSFHTAIPAVSMTVEQLITDTSELIQALTQRFNVAQLYVAGFSFGGTIAALTASRHPELVRAVICVDLDVQSEVADRVAYEFALEQATRLDNKRAIRALRRIGPPPHLESKTFGTRAKWVTNFGGVNRHATYTGLVLKLLRQLVFSRDYTLLDIIGTLRGMRFVQDHLLPDLANLNLFEMLPHLDVPVFLLQGRHDYVAPSSIAEQYYQALQAPKGKQLIWFEESAHMPQYEEPGKFREIVLTIKRHDEAGSSSVPITPTCTSRSQPTSPRRAGRTSSTASPCPTTTPASGWCNSPSPNRMAGLARVRRPSSMSTSRSRVRRCLRASRLACTSSATATARSRCWRHCPTAPAARA